MTTDQLLSEINVLPMPQRQRVVERALIDMTTDEQTAVERLLSRVRRRMDHPEIPDDFWTGFEQAEDGELVEMETALNQPYPDDQRE